ncbi:MAG: hypothetical protein JSU73_08590 [candidate division WOR-3 bacterium]|nr:MAG: hypothetical protein JSU73_08590 [candidate division WOR-3 bacterium]
MIPDARLVAFSAEIGRGHPSYLDSILQALRETHGIEVPVLTLNQVCTGRSKKAWDLARTIYRAGAQGGPVTWIYNRTRSEKSRPAAWQLRLLGLDLRPRLSGFDGICVAEHPLVAHILAPVCRVAYLHAEIAAPVVGVVPGVWRTFVPLEVTRRGLVLAGAEPAAITVTGLVVEPELVRLAEPAYRARHGRLCERAGGLTVGFFCSGAYPRPHLERIIAGVLSCLDSGHRVNVFAGTDQEKARRLENRLPADARGLGFIVCPDRRVETNRTAELFPELDVLVAAAHERTNWAVGLGLPMFVLMPNIGPFSPQNYRFARDQDVCRPLSTVKDARNLGPLIADLRRTGELRSTAERGYGPLPIGGAAVAASALLAGSA